jgi:RHS repeat-associated protein
VDGKNPIKNLSIITYPFGMHMPGRSFGSGSYRYGFQGQEKDDEIKGIGNSINYKYRVHDSRLGRFLSVDPLSRDYPWNSPYAFSENRLIDAVELEGLEKIEAYAKMNVAWTETKLQVVDGKEVETRVRTTLNLKVFISYDFNDGNSSASFFTSAEGIGSVFGKYDIDTDETDYHFTSVMLGSEFDRKFNEESLFMIPDWLASSKILKTAESYRPKTVDEARNLSDDEVDYIEQVVQYLKTIARLINLDKIDVSYQGYDGSENIGKNDQGETYNRKLTYKYRLSGKFATALEDGLNAVIDAKVDYTEEKCTSCD